jgi:predicted nucleic acid-binding protein
MRHRQLVFVDTGAWIALALIRDPLHERARDHWVALQEASASLHTSIPVVIETFTFLERNARRDVALAWKDSLYAPGVAKIHACDSKDLASSWEYFKRRDLRKLSAVDATSFAIMTRLGVRIAFAFDHHFAAVGFRMVG